MDVSKVDALKFDTVEKLFISIPEKAKTLLHSYVMLVPSLLCIFYVTPAYIL